MGTAVQPSIQAVIDSLTEEIRQGLGRPIFLRVERTPEGRVSVKQVEFLTPAQLAELVHVSQRTIYSWIENSNKNGLKYYKPPGSSGILFEFNEVLEWIKQGGVG